VALVDAASGRLSWVDDTECAFRPSFAPGDRLDYLRLGLSLWSPWTRELSRGSPRSLGLPDGMTYQIFHPGPGRTLLLGQPPLAQRGLWLLDAASPAGPRLLDSGLGTTPIDPRWVSRPQLWQIPSAGGVKVPVIGWPRTCGLATARGPALLIVHGGPAVDYGPRFKQDVQLLTASGVAVFAVNFRGSTGNGIAFRKLARDRKGQIEDVLHALSHMREQPDVDPRRIFLLIDSFGSALGYPALRARPGQVFAVIDWFGDRQDLERGAVPRGTPVFMATALRDHRLGASRTLAARWRQEGVRVTAREYDCAHDRSDAAARAHSLLDTAAFIASTAGNCDSDSLAR
jgi:acetyl esterase/lipase